MSATITKKLLTADEFAKLPNPIDGSKQELVHGEVITLPTPSFLHGVVVGNIGFALETYARQTKSGRVMISSGVITEHGPDTVRGPDVAFWSFKRLPADHVPVVYADEPADLCVEVISPSNTDEKMTRKVREYFASGVQLVWLVDPEERTVTVYRQPGDGRVLWDDATITGEDVLPGFTCPLAEFFQ
ncbi:MAG TPA: Uma2 family endonuclease [Gemmata sp.]|jgi:Uma2 family endonuclease|nr:Uma2 family endonuclease [Gemmata sp.]